MYYNYFKIAFRNIKRQKLYSIINIMGLSISIATLIFIILWVQDELQYERCHKNADKIYQAYKTFKIGNSFNHNPSLPLPLADAIKAEVPEIEDVTRMLMQSALVSVDTAIYNENNLCLMDPSAFNIFSYHFIKGNAETALKEPHSVVISDKIAKKYFGKENPIGKTITLDNDKQFIVSAIIEDMESKTDLNYDMYFPLNTFFGNSDEAKDWYSHFVRTYVLAKDKIEKDTLFKKMSRVIQKNMEDESNIELLGLPLSKSRLYNLSGQNQRIQYVFIFSMIGLLILIIACINYMNISTSLSVRRAREIGIKKVVGANKSQLAIQFLGESFIQTFIALLIAMMLVEILRPYFNTLTGKEILIPYLEAWFIPLLLCLLIITSLLAGSYPAFLLSSFKPLSSFRGKSVSGKGQANFRRGMVIFQFAISIALIISTLLIYTQLNYIKKKDLGFDRENILYFYMAGDLNEKFDSFKNELLQNPQIVSLCRSSALPSAVWSILRGMDWEDKEEDNNVSFAFISTDYDFLKTTGIDLLYGREFEQNSGKDSLNYYINEEALTAIGWEEPLGKKFGIEGDLAGRVIAVVKNFNSLPLMEKIEPLIITNIPEYYRIVIVRFNPENISSTVSFIEEKWNEYVPEFPFESNFMNRRIERYYYNEIRVGNLAFVFTILTILITCIGLFGLASHTAQQKTKEIGIRKVFGANVSGLVYLFVKNFTKWVLIANVIAWPISYFFFKDWLNNFAYRVDINWWIFAGASALALLIAVITVIYQSLAAAYKNPADSLRYE
ncbi:ABC transporter permease [Bacteroidota bacterium]